MKDIHQSYLNILEKIKVSKEEIKENEESLDRIMEVSNTLLRRVDNTSDLKLDAKVSFLYSNIFLKHFNNRIEDKLFSLETFIEKLNKNSLDPYFEHIRSSSRECIFTSFIDFNHSTIKKTRKIERTIMNIKEASLPSNSNIEIKEKRNLFIDKLKLLLEDNDTVGFYDLVLDPSSYCKSVENIFNVSIAVRSKVLEFMVKNNKLYISKFRKNDVKCDDHLVVDIDYETYINLLAKHNIRKPMLE